MFIKGFRFGMLLQFAIGPVCLFIFQVAVIKGFKLAEAGVLGVAVVDGIFITAAIMGLAVIIKRKPIKDSLKIIGSIILFIFGISTILSAFNISFLSLSNISGLNSVFFRAVTITISNPITIVFWAGVFSSKVAEENFNRKSIYTFGFGAVLSTLCFLTMVAIIGAFTKTFFPSNVIQILNLIVGFLLIGFSILMILKKHENYLHLE